MHWGNDTNAFGLVVFVATGPQELMAAERNQSCAEIRIVALAVGSTDAVTLGQN